MHKKKRYELFIEFKFITITSELFHLLFFVLVFKHPLFVVHRKWKISKKNYYSATNFRQKHIYWHCKSIEKKWAVYTIYRDNVTLRFFFLEKTVETTEKQKNLKKFLKKKWGNWQSFKTTIFRYKFGETSQERN